MLADTVRQMSEDGVTARPGHRDLGFRLLLGMPPVPRGHRAAARRHPGAPLIEKLPPFWSNSGFIEAMTERVREALDSCPALRSSTPPTAFRSQWRKPSPYEQQLREAAADRESQPRPRRPAACVSEPQRSALAAMARTRHRRLHPRDRGQSADRRAHRLPFGPHGSHVRSRLEAAELAKERGIEFVRAGTVGTHPLFVAGLRAIIAETLRNGMPACAPGCCPRPARPGAPPA